MAIFRSGQACAFSLSPHLRRTQKPYIFLLRENQAKLLKQVIPVSSLFACMNFVGMMVFSLSTVFSNKEKNDLILVISVSLALSIFFVYYSMFLWIKIKSLPFDGMKYDIDTFCVDKFTSTFLYIGCLSTIATPLLCLAKMQELSFFHGNEDALMKAVKASVVIVAFLMCYYCLFMIKSIHSRRRV